MATTRLDIRLDEAIKAKAEKASTLLGMSSLTEYLVRLMDENASAVIAEKESMTIEDDVFDRFIAACDKAAPNKALQDALTFTQESGF